MNDITTVSGTEPGSTGGTPPEGGSSAPAANWYDGFGEDNKNLAIDRQWSGSESAVESYRNLEKLTGAPPESLIRIPKHDATPEEQMDVWNRLGRPVDAKEYEFPTGDDIDENFQGWARDTFHKIGLPAGMAKQLVEAYDEMGQGMVAQQAEANQVKIAEETKALKTEWGAAHDQNVGVARMAAQNLGIDGGTIDQLEQTMGFAKVMKLFQGIGSKMGEGEFISGDQSGGGFGALAPEAAQARIATLKSDTSFVAKYTSGDAKSRAEMKQLHKWAYPE